MRTEIIKVENESIDQETLEGVAEELEQGSIVAIPTETVYGLAANADDEKAIERLKELKGRSEDKPFTHLIADFQDLYRYFPNPPEDIIKLGEKYWPGPLTIVVPVGPQGIGLRVPAHSVAREILRQTNTDIVVPSANPAEAPPAKNVEEVKEYYSGKIEMIVDCGPTLLKEASTVVRFQEDLKWEILREGLISRSMIAKSICKMILFVCTGNSCRSPIAEEICRIHLARQLGISIEELQQVGYRIVSAGTAAIPGGNASELAVRAMTEEGYDLNNHRTQTVSVELIESAERVFVMAQRHYDSIIGVMPNLADKVQMLDPSGEDVIDPLGGTFESYKLCVERIKKLIDDELIPTLLKNRDVD